MSTRDKDLSGNESAFLDTLSHSEGTYGVGDDGYNVLVGGTLFQGYEDHPHRLVHLNAHLDSTAAGRYQLLGRYFDAYKKSLGLDDFSPVSQDKIAIQQIRECRALADVQAGNFDVAVGKCAHIWASLPGAGYHQHENKLSELRDFFVRAGGQLIDT